MGRTSDARERLIEAGASLMHERGYTAVGVSEVCARAGVNKGSFYYYFPSKQELAEAVIDDHWQRYVPVLRQMAEGEGPPLRRLLAFFDANLEGHTETQRAFGKMLGCPFGNLVLEMSTQDETLRETLRGYFGRFVDHFEAVLTEAMERGDLPPQDARGSARAIVALLQGELMLAKMNDDASTLEGLGEKVECLIRPRDVA